MKMNTADLLNLDQAEASFNVLFERLSADGRERVIVSESYHDFLEMLRVYLRKERLEKTNGSKKGFDEQPDTVDALNALGSFCGRFPFTSLVDNALFEALLRLNEATPLRPDLLRAVDKPTTLAGGTIRHAIRFAKALNLILKESAPLREYRQTDQNTDTLSRLTPVAGNLNMKNSSFVRATLKGLAMELAQKFELSDPFHVSGAFRYQNRKFIPAELNSIRKPDEFFGYSEAKTLFKEHFEDFVKGKHNLPLLIGGLPGLGKTQMAIAFALALPEIKLILPGPESLQNGLEALIDKLSRSPHKFIVFFDDIDTRKIDWYPFRTHVGGSFALPSNILIVIASNYKFPPNISSRGRAFTFPLFDEIRCQEMIEDFLLLRGMKKVSGDLLAVIASDYVESFGQKLFDELSPRSLVRYLELYLEDTAKRKQMLEFSMGEVITKPDPQAFYAQNLKLLRALYGDEVIDEIREKELSGK